MVAATIIVLMRRLLYTWGEGIVQRHRITVTRREKLRRRKKAAAKRRRKAAERGEQQPV